MIQAAHRTVLATVVLVGCALASVAGCSDNVATASDPPRVSGIEIPAHSSQFQRDAVARYEAGEVITFEDYAEAVRGTKECLESVGFEITNEQNVTEGDKPAMTYDAKVPKALADSKGEEFFDAAYQDCWQNNSGVVESLYFQPTRSLEEIEAELKEAQAKYGPLAEKCLLDLGIVKPAGAEADWWSAASIEANQSLPGHPDCLEESGYYDATVAISDANG